MIRYSVQLRGPTNITIAADDDVDTAPRVDDYIMLFDSVTTTVRSVTFAPTMDPHVYVDGVSIQCFKMEELQYILRKAVDEGWSFSDPKGYEILARSPK